MKLLSKRLKMKPGLLSAHYLVSISGLSVTIFLAGLLGLEMQSAQTGVTPFWPASGIILAAFILYGIRLWPAVFIGMTGIAYVYNVPVSLAMISATGSVLEIIIPLSIVRKYGFTGSLDSLKQLLLFIAIAWTGPLISASIGSLTFGTLSTQLIIPVQNIFVIWWLGNSFGILLIGSSSILLFQNLKKLRDLIPSSPALVGIAIIAAIISVSAFQNMTNLNSAIILNMMIPLVILSSIFVGFAGTLIPVAISTLIMVIMFPTFPQEATMQYPLGILYLDILELWMITMTGLIVSTAHKEGIQHMKNNWLATHDGLTSLRNRRYLDKKLERLCFGLRQRDNSFCLLFLDLNKFKIVNDTAGHLVGDACLAHVARILEDCTRNSDTVARWGGDEFMLLLPDCSEPTAQNIASKINKKLESSPFRYNKQKFSLSFSIGIAASQSDDNPTSIIDRADKASYRAKLNGHEIALASAG